MNCYPLSLTGAILLITGRTKSSWSQHSTVDKSHKFKGQK